MAHDGPLARREPSFRTQEFRAVARHADGLLRDGLVVRGVVNQPRGVVERVLGGFEMHVAVSQGVGDRLVLADGATEDDAVFGVEGGFFDGNIPEAQGFSADETPLGVHAVHDDLEALAFLADERVGGDLVVVEEDLVGVDGAAAHFLDAFHFEAWRGSVEVDAEHGEAFGGFLDVFEGRGAGEEDHFLRDLRAGDPDLLAGDGVAVAVAGGGGFELEGVEAGVGLGDAEADAIGAVDDFGDGGFELLLVAEAGEGLGSVDVGVNGLSACHAGTGLGDGLEHHGCF